MIETVRKEGTPLTKDHFRASLAESGQTFEDPDTVVQEFIHCLTVHLIDDDKFFAARWQTRTADHLFDEVAAIKQILSGETRVISADEELNIELRGKLNSCKDLLDTERVKAAQLLLLKIRNDEFAEKYSKLSLARIANLLGVSALRLDEPALAEREFSQGVILSPKDGFIHSNLAASLIRLGRVDESFEITLKARTLLPDDRAVLATHILVLDAKNEYSEIALLLERDKDIENSPRCLLALGQSAIHQNHFDQAEQYFRRGCELDSDSAQLHFLLGRALFLPCQMKLFADPPMGGLSADSGPFVKIFEEVIGELSLQA